MNTSIFKNIDTEEKAYWLGFIYADGSVDNRHKKLKVTLSETDENHLLKLKKFLEHDKPLYRYEKKPFNLNSRYICKPQVELSVYSVELFNSLQVFGIVPNKTYNFCLDLSAIPHHLHKHFWRGMIDGDGCVVATDKSRVLQLTGHKEICQMFLDHIKEHFDTKVSILPDDNVFTIKFSKTLAGKIARYFYEDSIIHLERKYDKAMTITGCKNPVTKMPVLVKYDGVVKSYESIINFCKENNLNYKNVYYGYTKHNKYKSYEFVSAT
jgi:hypothetical protein